jgi:hypothetical protein
VFDELHVGANEKLEVDVVDVEMEDVHVEKRPTMATSETQTTKQQKYSIEDFRHNDAGVHFYTGLENILKFYFVLSTLGPSAYCLNYAYHNVKRISVPDQFFYGFDEAEKAYYKL